MKIFEKDGKTNFVDDNNVFVGFDNHQRCCENWGHHITKEIPTRETEDRPDETDIEGFQFDTSFFQDGVPGIGDSDAGGAVAFRLTRGEDQLFLTLFNSHNGYYSHGFVMKDGEKELHYGSI